jgi:hypothetical protein
VALGACSAAGSVVGAVAGTAASFLPTKLFPGIPGRGGGVSAGRLPNPGYLVRPGDMFPDFRVNAGMPSAADSVTLIRPTAPTRTNRSGTISGSSSSSANSSGANTNGNAGDDAGGNNDDYYDFTVVCFGPASQVAPRWGGMYSC